MEDLFEVADDLYEALVSSGVRVVDLNVENVVRVTSVGKTDGSAVGPLRDSFEMTASASLELETYDGARDVMEQYTDALSDAKGRWIVQTLEILAVGARWRASSRPRPPRGELTTLRGDEGEEEELGKQRVERIDRPRDRVRPHLRLVPRVLVVPRAIDAECDRCDGTGYERRRS